MVVAGHMSLLRQQETPRDGTARTVNPSRHGLHENHCGTTSSRLFARQNYTVTNVESRRVPAWGICTGLGSRQRHRARTSSPLDRRRQRSGFGQQLEPRLRFDPTEQRRAPFSVLRSPQAISPGRHRSALAPVQIAQRRQSPCATRPPTAATAGKEHQIIDDIDDYRASFQCPRCGAPRREPCQTLRPGAHIRGYHHERRYRHRELVDRGYIKYTLINDNTRHPLFLWRRPTQRPIIRDGYHAPG